VNVIQEIPMSKQRTSMPRLHQKGLSLIVVLLSLVTLAFASVALIRSIDTGTLVIGNLGFKKAATTSSDQSADTAITWLQANLAGTTLYTDITTDGQAYYATSIDALDPSGNSRPATGVPARPFVDWGGNSCGGCVAAGTCSTCVAPSSSTTTDDGYTHRYLITRLCKCTGDPNGNCADGSSNICSTPITNTASASPKRGELKYGDNVRFTGSSSPFFRIIVRTDGPRNTASVTETYIHF
jgi:Tfp pilus assembly protein PilX